MGLETNTSENHATATMEDPLATRDTNVDIAQALESMIVSASGWRKVFASSGNEEDNTTEVSLADRYLAATAALAYGRHLPANAHVLVGSDARPTGPVLAALANRILIACGHTVSYLAVISAPAIMAASKEKGIDGFFYISASHNPIGHNGFKFGSDGGVTGGSESAALAQTFRNLAKESGNQRLLASLSSSVSLETYRKVLDSVQANRMRALASYEHLAHATLAASDDPDIIASALQHIASCVSKRPLGIVGELNGSARGEGIDGVFLANLGIKTLFANATPGHIVHGIVPEGENLELCRTLLEEAHQKDPSFLLGYVPDNDGDRGNIAWIDHRTGRASILGAQELFALVAAVELAQNVDPTLRKVVAVNCPTSLMIETIASSCNASVARAEVGEANVVSLAAHLRNEGYCVRILGEGSNGGNITHPSKVRDPLNTLVSLAKLLTDPEVFARVTAGGTPTETPDWSMSGALGMLPKRTITPSFSREAVMHIACTDHAKLKRHYEHLFMADVARDAVLLQQRFGIHGWREEQTEGIACRIGTGDLFRSPQGRGGLKIVFLDKNGTATDFIWMRGSGTEPVFRIMADALGTDQERHDYLLSWQRSLVKRSDALATSP